MSTLARVTRVSSGDPGTSGCCGPVTVRVTSTLRTASRSVARAPRPRRPAGQVHPAGARRRRCSRRTRAPSSSGRGRSGPGWRPGPERPVSAGAVTATPGVTRSRRCRRSRARRARRPCRWPARRRAVEEGVERHRGRGPPTRAAALPSGRTASAGCGSSPRWRSGRRRRYRAERRSSGTRSSRRRHRATPTRTTDPTAAVTASSTTDTPLSSAESRAGGRSDRGARAITRSPSARRSAGPTCRATR